MNLIGGIKVWLEGWESIDEKDVPQWVNEAYGKWERKLGIHPYNMTKHFVGKTFVCRVRHGMGNQGEAPILGRYGKNSSSSCDNSFSTGKS